MVKNRISRENTKEVYTGKVIKKTKFDSNENNCHVQNQGSKQNPL